MLSFARKRVIAVFVFFCCALFAFVKFGPVGRADETPMMVPAITATDQDAIVTDVDGDGRADPGDTIRYTVVISNVGTDATGVNFADILDPNITLVPGSINVTPITVNDTYTATGNIRIQEPDGATDLLGNDINPVTGSNAGLTVTTQTVSSTNCTGGCSNNVVVAANGSFAYTPPPGFEGADTFTYTATDGVATATGMATVNVSGMIWFVNAATAAGGNGTLTSPFNCLVGAGCYSGSANDNGDNIFLYNGAYTGGVTLKAGQKLIGQGATTTLAALTGITLAPNSDALPALNGTPSNVTITTSAAATAGITLTTGATANYGLRGFNIGNTTGFKILSGASFGTLVVSEVGLSGTGGALGLTSGTLAAAFTSITSTSSAAQGISMVGAFGSLTSTGGTTIGGNTSQCILISGSVVTANFGNTSCTGGTDGISLQNNPSGNRTFGTLNVSGNSGIGFRHESGGGTTNVGVTTITNPGGTGISIDASTTAITFGGTTVNKNATNGTGVLFTNSIGTLTFGTLGITTQNGTGLLATENTGQINVTLPNDTISATSGPAIEITKLAAPLSPVNLNFSNVNSTTSSTQGVKLVNVSGTIVTGGGVLAGSAGANMQIQGGSVSVTQTGGISHTANASLALDVSGGHTGTVSISSMLVNAGAGAQFDNADGSYTLAVIAFNSPTGGINIQNGSSGTFAVGGQITNPAGVAYREDTSTANVTFNATITKNNNANSAVGINAKSGGTTTFNGAISASTTTANAIDLTNTGGTVNFTGGLGLTTTSGVGFNATGAGATVSATQNNGTIVNTTSSTTGTALNVANTAIGASALTFRSISSNGGANGIVLNNTGANAGLTVTGTGSTAGSGGTIQLKTGDCISLTSTKAFNLANMNITDAGNNVVSNDNSNWIDATTVNGLTLTNIHATGSVGHGVKGDSVTNLVVSGSVFNGGGLDNDQANFHGFDIHNLLGTSSVTSSTFSHSNTIQFHVNNDIATNFAGTPDQLTVSGTTWNLHTDPFAGDHLSVNSDTGGNFKLIVNNTSGQNTFVTGGTAVQATAGGTTGKMDADISGVTSGGSLASGNNNTAMAVIGETGGGSINYDVHNSTSLGTGSVAIKVTHASASGTSHGTIQNNTITHVAGPGTDAIAIDVDGVGATGGTGTLSILNNSVSGNYQRGILVQSGQHGVINATINGNTMFGTDTTGVGLQHISVVSGISGGIASTMRLNMLNNTVTQGAGATYTADFRLNNMVNGTYELQDFVGSGSSVANIQTWVLTTKTNHPNGTGTVTVNINSPFSASVGPIPTRPSPGVDGTIETASNANKAFNFLNASYQPPTDFLSAIQPWKSESNAQLIMDNGQFEQKPANTGPGDVWTNISVAQTSIQGLDTSVPGTETSVPGTETSIHSSETSVPGTETSIHSSETSVPGTETSIHSSETSVPGTETSIHSSETSVPGTETDIHTGQTDIHTWLTDIHTALTGLLTRLSDMISPTALAQDVRSIKDGLTKDPSRPESGEAITVNGGGPGFLLPAGKTTTITFRGTLNTGVLPAYPQVSNQGTIVGNNFGTVITDDPDVAGGPQATLTQMDVTTVVVTATPNPSMLGQNVTFLATMTGVPSRAGDPSGTLQFKDNGVNIGPATAVSIGTVGDNVSTAQFTTSALTAGSHTITALYSGGGAGALAYNTNLGSLTGNPQVVVTPTATATATNTPTTTPTNTPTASPTPSAVISGTVTYGNALGSPPPPRFVSNVMINGAGSPNVSTMTAPPGPTAGQYTLTGFGAGAYTVTPTKSGSVNGITSFDAARISQHAAGTMFLTGNQLLVADVSGNGNITSFDAAEVSNYVVTASPAGSSGTWKFVPVNRSYPSVTTVIPAQDYAALLMGEVSGNWVNPIVRPGEGGSTGPQRTAVITAPRLVTPADTELLIPVSIDGAADKGIIAYEFDLRYDPSVIQPRANPVDLAGTVSSKLSVAANADEAGLLRVAVYGPVPIDGNGLLMNLRFVGIGAPGSVSPLSWERFMLNEDEITSADGQVELSAAGPKQAEVTGRVLNSMGQGVPNARVTLADSTGKVLSTLSNGFGVYRFGGLQVGQTYTIGVDAKRLVFTPLTVSVTGQTASVDVIAE